MGGVFDGNDHKITGLTIDDRGAGNDYLGLFGRISDEQAQVKNIGLENVSITGGADSYYLGGLCGRFQGGTISNTYSTGSVSGDFVVGGLCGFNNDGTIRNCYAKGNVQGNERIGGLCGWNTGTISNSCAIGSVIGGADYYTIGGLCGLNDWGWISNCYSVGSVSGHGDVGGLCGRNYYGTISNTYSTGSVSGHSDVGGLCGHNYDGTISNTYSTGSVSGDFVIGGLCGHNNYYGTISNTYSTGSVSGDFVVGGLCGGNVGVISNCYSTGDVNGVSMVGGFVGQNYSSNISNCYSTGNVNGVEDAGGLVGWNFCYSSDCGTITDSYWDIETSGEPNMCGHQEPYATGCDPNYGRTTAELHQQSTFTDWDFINTWNIGENQTYPYLRTVPAGDINKDRIVNFLDLSITANQWMEE